MKNMLNITDCILYLSDSLSQNTSSTLILEKSEMNHCCLYWKTVLKWHRPNPERDFENVMNLTCGRLLMVR